MNVENHVYIKKTKDFKKIFIELIYPYKREEKWTIPASLLVRILLKKTKSISNEEDFLNALIKNYIMSFQISRFNLGENSFFRIHIALPDNKVLKDSEFIYQKSMQFFLDAIYNPCLVNNCFAKKDLDVEKNKLKSTIESSLNNINSYASIKLDEIIDDENYFSDSIFNHQKDIDLVTSEKLYEFYKQVIKNNQPLIFIIGNVDKQFKKDLINLFPKNLSTYTLNYNYFKSFKPVEKLKEIEEIKDYSQSIIKFAYKIKDYNKEDIPILSLVNFLLSSGASNILHEYLRTKENLVYTSSSSPYFNYGVMIITAQISRENKDKTIQTIYEIINCLQDENFIKRRLKSVLKQKWLNIEMQKDFMKAVLEDFIDENLKYRLSSSKEYKIIKNICPRDIINFIKRFELDTIYYLKGTK